MAIAYAFACEKLGMEVPEVKKDADLRVDVAAVLPILRRAERVLREKAAAATMVGPKKAHVRPF